jgi:hypothetical protein
VLRDAIRVGDGNSFPLPRRIIPISPGDYEPEADNLWRQALAAASALSPVYWYVRSRVLHVAPEAVALRYVRTLEV